MIFPDNFENKIGFDVVRRQLLTHCASELGADWCRAVAFSSDHGTIVSMLEQTNEMLAIEQSKRDFPLDSLFDLRDPLKEIAAPGTSLSTDHLSELYRQLVAIEQIVAFFKRGEEDNVQPYKHIKRIAGRLDAAPEVKDAINRVIDKQGVVRDSASPLLQQLRATLAHTTASIAGIMRRVIAQGKAAGTLDADVQPTMRDGRLVLPVAPANKRRVRGIVHDESATGKTLFIEPEEIVEANNRIRETEAEIDREILRILIELTDAIRPYAPALLDNLDTLGQLDFIRAKARFALDVGGEMPTVHREPLIEWFHAVHPALLLSLREHGKEVVPLEIKLDDKQRVIVISGPNAGGKSVCLKTVGIVQYMAQCGILPPMHSNSHIGVFDNMFVDIGDQQSIEDDLSTYSSHLRNMKQMLARGDSRTLILIDEFGSGTEPQIGGAIAQAILGRFATMGVMGVITTHYHNLKQMAEDTDGLVNGAMLYDRGRMKPLFQLQVGYPGSSFAIEIARGIGLPADVLDRAAEIVGSDYINMDRFLLDIVRDRKYWLAKRQEIRLKEKQIDDIAEQYNSRLQTLAEQQRQILSDARAEARDIVRQSNAQIERTIKEIKEMQAERERTREARQQLEEFRQRLNGDDTEMPQLPLEPLKPATKPKKKPKRPERQPDTERPLQPGDTVVIKGGNSVGTIINIDEKYVTLTVGAMSLRIETSRVERTKRKPADEAQHSSVSRATLDDIRERQLAFKPDIDVRGMRADEALQAVTYFIDDAIQFSAKRVRILHGTGNGILREVIRNYLGAVPGVTRYRDEDVRLGGAGITVVDIA